MKLSEYMEEDSVDGFIKDIDIAGELDKTVIISYKGKRKAGSSAGKKSQKSSKMNMSPVQTTGEAPTVNKKMNQQLTDFPLSPINPEMIDKCLGKLKRD